VQKSQSPKTDMLTNCTKGGGGENVENPILIKCYKLT
jgi:hypothetical protein